MQVNLFSSQTFEVIKHSINRFLTPQQQRICAIAVLAFSCLATAYLILRCCFNMSYDPEFENGLNAWIEDEKGDASKAAERIRHAYYNKKIKLLDLIYQDIKSLPPEIGQLANLTSLDLYSNQIESVPESIGQLANLTWLNLSYNKIENLPESIGQLANLTALFLFHNNIESVPESIGQLANLTRLQVSNNNIESVPESIGQLANLTRLQVSNNKIKSLPESIGNLVNLRAISLDGNPIDSLPLSLGQCTSLTSIDSENTLIPLAQKDAILAMCQALRANEAVKILPTRLKTWQTFAGQAFKLEFIENLTEKEKQTINEWLTRLEHTRDFNIASHQKKLAKSVCQMLESLETSPSFKEIFFIQVPANLVACGDRAAMSFNELGLAWTSETLILSLLSTKEKLNTLVQVAKTQALHQALQKSIEAQEKKTATEITEGVEVYLYYETHLKDKLNLLTFMSDMIYSEIGKRDWIQEETLVEEVVKNYEKCLLDIPSLLLMCKADAKFNADWQKIEDKLYAEMEGIDSGDLNGGDYTLQMNELKQSFESQKRTAMLNWVKSEFAK